MSTTFKVTRKQAKSIIELTFPEYRGRKINVTLTDVVAIYDTNWSGGTRNQYVAVHVSGETNQLTVLAPWMHQIDEVTIPQDVIVVKHAYFCGKDCGLTIYVHPDCVPDPWQLEKEL